MLIFQNITFKFTSVPEKIFISRGGLDIDDIKKYKQELLTCYDHLRLLQCHFNKRGKKSEFNINVEFESFKIMVIFLVFKNEVLVFGHKNSSFYLPNLIVTEENLDKCPY